MQFDVRAKQSKKESKTNMLSLLGRGRGSEQSEGDKCGGVDDSAWRMKVQ